MKSNSEAIQKDPTPTAAIDLCSISLFTRVSRYLSIYLSSLESLPCVERVQARETATEPPANNIAVNQKYRPYAEALMLPPLCRLSESTCMVLVRHRSFPLASKRGHRSVCTWTPGTRLGTGSRCPLVHMYVLSNSPTKPPRRFRVSSH